jgi:hypothetical protein
MTIEDFEATRRRCDSQLGQPGGQPVGQRTEHNRQVLTAGPMKHTIRLGGLAMKFGAEKLKQRSQAPDRG